MELVQQLQMQPRLLMPVQGPNESCLMQQRSVHRGHSGNSRPDTTTNNLHMDANTLVEKAHEELPKADRSESLTKEKSCGNHPPSKQHCRLATRTGTIEQFAMEITFCEADNMSRKLRL
jgi:hypothetical protein